MDRRRRLTTPILAGTDRLARIACNLRAGDTVLKLPSWRIACQGRFSSIVCSFRDSGGVCNGASGMPLPCVVTSRIPGQRRKSYGDGSHPARCAWAVTKQLLCENGAGRDTALVPPERHTRVYSGTVLGRALPTAAAEIAVPGLHRCGGLFFNETSHNTAAARWPLNFQYYFLKFGKYYLFRASGRPWVSLGNTERSEVE